MSRLYRNLADTENEDRDGGVTWQLAGKIRSFQDFLRGVNVYLDLVDVCMPGAGTPCKGVGAEPLMPYVLESRPKAAE